MEQNSNNIVDLIRRFVVSGPREAQIFLLPIESMYNIAF